MFRRRKIGHGGWVVFFVVFFVLNTRVVSATEKPQWLRQRSSTALESESRFFNTCYGETCRDDNEFKSSIGLSCIAHKAWIRDTGEDCFTRWLTSSWMQDVYSSDDVFQVIEHCPCTCRVDCTADIMSNLQQVKALVSANTAKVKAKSLSPSLVPSVSPSPAPSLRPSREKSEAQSLDNIISNIDGGAVTPSPTPAPTQVVRSESPSLKTGSPSLAANSTASSANSTTPNHSSDLPTLDQNSTEYTAESRSYQPPETSPLSEKQFGLKDIIAIVGSVAAGGAVLLIVGFGVATSMARRRVRKKRRRKRRKRRSDDEYPRRKRQKEEYVGSARSGGSSKSKRHSKKKRGGHRSDETFASDISPSPLRNGPALFDDTGNTIESDDFIYSGRRGRRW